MNGSFKNVSINGPRYQSYLLTLGILEMLLQWEVLPVAFIFLISRLKESLFDEPKVTFV